MLDYDLEYDHKLMESVCRRLFRGGWIHGGWIDLGPEGNYRVEFTQLGRDKILSIGDLLVPFAPAAFGVAAPKSKAQVSDYLAVWAKIRSLLVELEPPTWTESEGLHFIMLVLSFTKESQPGRN